MKKRIIISILLGQISFAQTAFQNTGNVQIHPNGSVGFHTNLINDGVFDKNEGLVGFYSLDDYLVVAGKNEAIFKNVEIDVFDNLYLNTSMGITNELLFVTGKVVTPRNDTTISLDFFNHQLYVGEGDANHVDGYAKVVNQGEFVFPIGDDNSFRPMILPNQTVNSVYKGAYFRENPNSPSTFSSVFNTDSRQKSIVKVNTREFWDLDGAKETTVKLTWNIDSGINALAYRVENLRVVGWSSDVSEWVDLGNVKVTGNLDEGTIESSSFLPDNFEIITIGSDTSIVRGIFSDTNRNYGISPNGDGLNDTFIIKGIEYTPNNMLQIYNRWGILVYSKRGYDNSWGGFSDGRSTITASEGLPEGTYFYILEFEDEGLSKQGYIYLKR